MQSGRFKPYRSGNTPRIRHSASAEWRDWRRGGVFQLPFNIQPITMSDDDFPYQVINMIPDKLPPEIFPIDSVAKMMSVAGSKYLLDVLKYHLRFVRYETNKRTYTARIWESCFDSKFMEQLKWPTK